MNAKDGIAAKQEGDWYVLHTRPRHERKVYERLAARGFSVYCPGQQQWRQWSDRKKKIWVPLFPSYCFIQLSRLKDHQNEILATPGVIRFLIHNGVPGRVQAKEMDMIRHFLNQYRDLPIEWVPQAGEQVSIEEGPLRSYLGEVIHTRGHMVYLQIQSLPWCLKALVPIRSLKEKQIPPVH